MVFDVFSDFAVLVDERLVVPWAFVPAEDAVLFETHFGDVVGVIFLQAHLPFAGQCGGVPRRLQDVAEGNFFRRDMSPVFVVSKAVSAGHNLYARRRADWRAITVGEANPSFGKPVEVGSFIRCPPVAAEHFAADVIGHYENDVGPLGRHIVSEPVREAGTAGHGK